MIDTFEQRPEVPRMLYVDEKSPFARSFVNFWLLSEDRLKPGFSWREYECIAQPGTGMMISQTASFLEETCKDLLVLNQQTKKVDFLHRTVYDFLTDKKAEVTLDEDVPAHFSDENFIFELAKLRCMCILREAHAGIGAILDALDHILYLFQNVAHLDANASWLLTCESLTILQLQTVPGYRGEGRFHRHGLSTRSVKARLSKTVLKIHKHMPSLVHTRDCCSLDLLGDLLHAATNIDIRSPELMLYRGILEHGCNPNASVGHWPRWGGERYPFISSEESKLSDTQSHFDWCPRTTWQAWLGEAYLQTQRRVNAELSGQTNRVLDMQKQWLGALVDLLLRYGADPRCTICITDHEYKKRDNPEEFHMSCNHVTLEEILEQIVPAENVVQLRKLRDLCSDGGISHVLRKNQQKRAVRSLMTSERNFSMVSTVSTDSSWPSHTMESLRMEFLESLTDAVNLPYSVCNGCSWAFEAALVTWCIECQGLSFLCLSCSLSVPSEVPDLVSLCNNLAVPHGSRNGGHTSVTFLWEYDDFRNGDELTVGLRDYADVLHARYSTDQAIAFLKEWYAKDPIEPDLTFEEAIQGIVMLPVPFEPYQSYQDVAADVPHPEPAPTEAATSQAAAGSSPKAPVDAVISPHESSSKPENVPNRSLRPRLKRKFSS
jgi:hypothetical protein